MNTHKDYEVFRSPLFVYKCLYDNYPNLIKGDVLDPSAGDGRMILELINRGNNNKHMLCDIREEEITTWKNIPSFINAEFKIGNFLEIESFRKFDSIITNPPFTLTVPFIEHGMKWLKDNGNIAILQRSNWLGTYKRSQWLKQSGLRYVLVIPKRPIWEIDGRDNRSDTYEYFWFIFQKGYTGLPEVDWLL
jgi:hypothetical protein